jgi:hypothetical protein
MHPYALYVHTQISRPALESPEHARRRKALRELEFEVRERRAQRRRELVSRALAIVAARRKSYDDELPGAVG